MRFVYRNGKVIEEKGYENKPWAISVISDTMQPLKHHGTGRMIDSKSKFRADTKACGATEIGNEHPKQRQSIPLDRGQRREAIRKALYQARNA